jgi:poly(3-hydroxybutyrate) depolymerase
MKRGALVVAGVAALFVACCQTAGRLRPDTSLRYLTVGGLERRYALHVPVDLPPGPVPLVLMFHGGGGTPAFAERDSRWSALTEVIWAFFASPRRPESGRAP